MTAERFEIGITLRYPFGKFRKNRHGAAAAQAGAGRPGAWRPATEHQGVAGRRLLQRVRVVPVVPVVRVSGVGRGHQAGRAFPDGRPVVAPAVLPGRAVNFVDAGVGVHGAPEGTGTRPGQPAGS